MKKSFAGILLLSLLIGCQKGALSEGNAQLVVKTIGSTTNENFDRIGFTALEMLKKNHEVEFAFGSVIKCIDGVCAQSGYWWPMYVNGNLSSIGAQAYPVANNDKIEFVLSKR
jgi:hypothetical protein